MADDQQTTPVDPAALYAQLTPEQRAAFAQQFVTQFQGASDDKSKQLAAVDPKAATPQQVAEMHEHASNAHPGFLEGLLNHPIATSALAGLAVYGAEKYFKSRESK